MDRFYEFMRHFDQVLERVLIRLGSLSEEHAAFRPAAGMMTLQELIVHMFSQVEAVLSGIQKGELADQDFKRAEQSAARISGLAQVLDYGHQVRSRVESWWRTEDTPWENLVPTFFAPVALPPDRLLSAALEHLIHHRGQIEIYLRLAERKHGHADG